ncbi:hypothetical protein A1D23_03330 [Chelonobacter oris]|nr:hypothetical protein [Chelonobacter oris]
MVNIKESPFWLLLSIVKRFAHNPDLFLWSWLAEIVQAILKRSSQYKHIGEPDHKINNFQLPKNPLSVYFGMPK